MSFYDELSSYYDQMISFESRFENEKKIFKNVLDKFYARTVLDAGCGSGYYSIILSSLGLGVTGFDSSNKMIDLARQNAKRYKYKINFFNADFLNFQQKIDITFDSLYTLGNSFVHLITKKDLYNALNNFYNILDPEGYACIGIVNYDKLFKSGELEISKKEKNGIEFHRYNTLNEKTITFHVKISGKEKFHFKTELYPLTSEELKELSDAVGFKNIHLYGNMKLENYNKYESENIVAFLKK
jgi:ubiquinone/menaquinone biosynthesis C-methylase UbiE